MMETRFSLDLLDKYKIPLHAAAALTCVPFPTPDLEPELPSAIMDLIDPSLRRFAFCFEFTLHVYQHLDSWSRWPPKDRPYQFVTLGFDGDPYLLIFPLDFPSHADVKKRREEMLSHGPGRIPRATRWLKMLWGSEIDPIWVISKHGLTIPLWRPFIVPIGLKDYDKAVEMHSYLRAQVRLFALRWLSHGFSMQLL